MRPNRRRVTPDRRAERSGHVPKKISLIGAGAVGSTLCAALFEKGFEVVSIVGRTARTATDLAKAVRCKRVSTSLSDISPSTELLVIAVPDDTIAEVVRECARKAPLKKPLAVHTSGVHSLHVLEPLQRVGALVGSMHPVQSFPKATPLPERVSSVRGIYFGVEGENKALGMVQQIVRKLDARTVVIPRGLKPLYHCACVFASNYVVTLLNAVAEASRASGFERQWREIMLPLFTTTVENAMKTSPAEALTGPVVRNDVQTIGKHLDTLRKCAPQLLPLYSVMGVDTARIARQSGSLTPGQFRELVGVIRKYVQTFAKKH